MPLSCPRGERPGRAGLTADRWGTPLGEPARPPGPTGLEAGDPGEEQAGRGQPERRGPGRGRDRPDRLTDVVDPERVEEAQAGHQVLLDGPQIAAFVDDQAEGAGG